MKKYKIVDITEQQLEELVRKRPNLIEEGLRYIDHQRKTDRGPLDVLFADSGNSLVVAELKVVEDETMLVQGIDYYDYITSNIEGLARAYKGKEIDPTQEPRLFLIAPNFSIPLLNRCKWVDIPVSLFTFQCLIFEDSPEENVLVFKEITVPSRREPVEVYTLDEKLDYITDSKVRKNAEELLREIKKWGEGIQINPIKYAISIKVSGVVLMYVGPRRNYFIVGTTNKEGMWTSFPIRQPEDLEEVMPLLKSNYEKLK